MPPSDESSHASITLLRRTFLESSNQWAAVRQEGATGPITRPTHGFSTASALGLELERCHRKFPATFLSLIAISDEEAAAARSQTIDAVTGDHSR